MRASSRRAHHCSSSTRRVEAPAHGEPLGLEAGQADLAPGRRSSPVRAASVGHRDRPGHVEVAAHASRRRPRRGRPSAPARAVTPSARRGDRRRGRTPPPGSSASTQPAPLDGAPQRRARSGASSPASARGTRGPSGVDQLGEPARAWSSLGPADDQRQQQVVELLGVAHARARPRPAPARWRPASSRPSDFGLERQAAAQLHGAGAALLERGVVEERVGLAVEDLVREHRRLGRLDEVDPHRRPPPCAAAGSTSPSTSIASCRQSSMVWRTSTWSGISIGPAGRVLLAGGQGREDRGHQVVGLHALDGQRVLLARPGSAARPGSG